MHPLFGDSIEFRRTSSKRAIFLKALEFVGLQFIFIPAWLLFAELTIVPKFVVYIYSAYYVAIVAWRFIYIYSIGTYRRSGYNQRSVVIAGHGTLATELKTFLDNHPESGYTFQGYFSENAEKEEEVKNIQEIPDFAQYTRVDEIYCCLPDISFNSVKSLIEFAEKNFIKVKLIADFRGFEFSDVQLENFGHIPVLNVTSYPLDVMTNRFIKRTFDVVFSVLFLFLIFSWLCPLIALIIKLDSTGPVFFVQKRNGRSNNEFFCLKFRTMYVNEDSDRLQTTRGDKRVTPVGRLLRRTSLDELPQFLNVLIGNMSVVGPRPHMVLHTQEFSKKVDRFLARHYVKPGITGLAQAKGVRGETKELSSMEKRVKYDNFYIKKWSMLLDIKIIILTIFGLVKDKNHAY